MRLDWTIDSVYRFFPVQEDEDFGYCLHRADLAVNKVLALVGRSELRDFLDTLELDRTYLSLGAMIWAACGKDEGYTPSLILDMTNRHSRYQEGDLKVENLARQVDLKELKLQWLAARESAVDLFARLPTEEIGCLDLNQDNEPVMPIHQPRSPHVGTAQSQCSRGSAHHLLRLPFRAGAATLAQTKRSEESKTREEPAAPNMAANAFPWSFKSSSVNLPLHSLRL